MYCSNFVEDFTNKVIDKLNLPCSIKKCGSSSYIHYNWSVCKLINGNNNIFNKDIIPTYIDILISCLHEEFIFIAFDMLKAHRYTNEEYLNI